jgi:sulfoxide reductase heme-binding subunit YedZ
VGSKRYVLVGLVAFLLLIPLAVTSTRGWMKHLGMNW